MGAKMKIIYNPDEDTMRIVFSETVGIHKDLGDGIAIDYDEDGRLASIDIRHPMSTAAGKDVFRQIVVEGIGPFLHDNPLIIVPRLFSDSQSVG
jgi:uncharacterized protein YuzE